MIENLEIVIKGLNRQYIDNGRKRTDALIKKEQEIIGSKNSKNILKFAYGVMGADIDALSQAIASTKKAEDIYWFALNVDGAAKYIKVLEQGIINSGNPYYIVEFAKNIKGADIDALANAVVKTKQVFYIKDFAYRIKNANLEILSQGIVASKNAFHIYNFALQI